VLDDVGRIEVLEGRDEFQLDLSEHTAEGGKHVGAEAQAEGIRGHTADTFDQQGNDQPDTQEKELEDHNTGQHQEKSVQVIIMTAAEDGDGQEREQPDDQISNGKAGQGGKKLGGQHLDAADWLAQQEVSGQLVLFDRDQTEAIVTCLDSQTDLDENEEEAVKTQHRGQIHPIHAEGSLQFRRELRQHFVHQGGLISKGREDGKEEEEDCRRGQRPYDHRPQSDQELVLIDGYAHGACLFVVVHEDLFQGWLFDGNIIHLDANEFLQDGVDIAFEEEAHYAVFSLQVGDAGQVE
jgi:hypothetical protein